MNTLFQTRLIISSLGQTNLKGNVYTILLRRIHGWRKHLEMVLSPNDEEVASSKKHSQFKTRVHKSYPISDQNGQN